AAAVSVYRARALLAAGVLADAQLDSGAADELTNRSFEMHRQLEDKQGMATALNALAFQTSRRGDYAQARSYIEKVLLLWKELGAREIVLGLSNLASIARRQGDFATARATYEGVIEAFQSSGDARGIACALNGLGEVARAEGDYAGARHYYERSLAGLRQIDNRWEIASVLRDLGDLSREEGDCASSCDRYGDAL